MTNLLISVKPHWAEKIATYRFEDSPSYWYNFYIAEGDTILWEESLSEPTNQEIRNTISTLKEKAAKLGATVQNCVDELLEDCQTD